MTYEIHSNSGINIIRWDDNGITRWVPTDPANRHYQEYLEWVAEGNTALVIEEEA